MYRILWVFFVYAFLGWCAEVVFAAILSGRFINRGFLNGPICPIYGFAVTAVLLCLAPLKANIPLLFAGSLVLTTAVEFLAGFFLEHIFHQKWWDYTEYRFNLGGYVCLRFSLLWAVASTAAVLFLQPALGAALSVIPRVPGIVMLTLFLAATAADVTVTVAEVKKFNKRLSQIEDVARALRAVSDKIGGSVAGGTIIINEKAVPEIAARYNELKAKQKELTELFLYEQARLLRAFPHLRLKSPAYLVEQVKTAVSQLRLKK